MKILLIARYFPPLQSVATERMESFARTWAKLGHEVFVLTTTKKVLSTPIPGVQVIEIDYFDPLGKGQGSSGGSNPLLKFYRRRMNERMPNRSDHWILKGRQALSKFSNIDLIVSSYGPYSAHLIAMEAKKRFNCFWIADFRDLWVDNHNYKGLFPFTLVERWLEKRVMKKADLVTTVSEGLKERLKQKYPKVDVEVVRNGFSAAKFPKDVAPLKRPFHFLYTGTVFEGVNNYEELQGAFDKLDATLEFIGTHPNPPKTPNCYYSGRVSVMKSLEMQLQADALVLMNFQASEYKGIIGTKVYEYLYAKKPILAAYVDPHSELGRMLTRTGGAVLTSDINEGVKKIMRGEYPPHDLSEIQKFERAFQAETIIEFSQRTMSTS